MYGWLCKLLFKSRASSPCKEAQHEEVNKVKASPATSSYSFGPETGSVSPQAALSSPVRWSRKYDLFVCHSSVQVDIEEATRLVSCLEASPYTLRCFLCHRDCSPGGAVSTELCQAVQNSHCRALLITADFLEDDWCTYVMHQALAEGPMSNCLIPLVLNLSHCQYPQELKFYYYITLTSKPERGYTLVKDSVLKYLTKKVKEEKTHYCKVESSSNTLVGMNSSHDSKMVLNGEPSESSLLHEGTEKTKTKPSRGNMKFM